MQLLLDDKETVKQAINRLKKGKDKNKTKKAKKRRGRDRRKRI